MSPLAQCSMIEANICASTVGLFNPNGNVRLISEYEASLRAVPSSFKPESSLLVTACSEGDSKYNHELQANVPCHDQSCERDLYEAEGEDAKDESEADTVTEGESESADIRDGEWEHADSSNDNDSVDENVVVATINKNNLNIETTSISPRHKKRPQGPQLPHL
eukprot:CFRG5953T1